MIHFLLTVLGLFVAFIMLDLWAFTCPPFVETYEGRYGA